MSLDPSGARVRCRACRSPIRGTHFTCVICVVGDDGQPRIPSQKEMLCESCHIAHRKEHEDADTEKGTTSDLRSNGRKR